MEKRQNFSFSDQKEPHRDITKKILKEHPEIKKLIGKNPKTFWIIFGLVTLQITLAWLVVDQSWWIIIGLSYLVGAFIDHGLFVMIHECAHNLLFKKRANNMLASMFANIPMVFIMVTYIHGQFI